jgi:hypothetical protein
MFFIPILAAEQSQWSQLAYIYATTEESARAGVASDDFNPVFWVEYAPPLDLEPLFQQVTVDLEP